VGSKTGGVGTKGVLSSAWGEMRGAGVIGIEGATTREEVVSRVGASTLRDGAGAGAGWLGLVVPCRMSISC